MRLLEYFAAPLFYLQSPLTLEQCTHRINAAAGSVFNPFLLGVAGFVWMSSVRLRYRSALHEFGTKPVLVGRIDPRHGGTQFTLRLRAAMPVYFAAAMAVPMLLMILYIGLLAIGGLGVSADGAGPLLVIAVVLVILPFLMFLIGVRNAEAHRDALLRFLEQHVQARPLAEHLRPEFPRW